MNAKKNEQKELFISESSLLVMMIDATMMQSTMIKTPQLKQQIKQVFTPFFNHGRNLSKSLKKYLMNHTEMEIAYEEVAPFVYEAMREIAKSKNQLEALALLKAYNEGNVTVKK